MGCRVIACLADAPDLALVGALEAPGHAALGRDAGEVAGIGRLGVPITPAPPAVLTRDRILVEFSVPEATLEHLRIVARGGGRAALRAPRFTASHPQAISPL